MRLQVISVLLMFYGRAVMGYGCGDGQGGMWDHRSTRRPLPPQAAQAREGEAGERKPKAATRHELDAIALTSAEKRRAEVLEEEGGGGSRKRWCGATERPEDGGGADGAGLNGHEESSHRMREAANEEFVVDGGQSQLDVPDGENMDDR
jgi:hypothetical protein